MPTQATGVLFGVGIFLFLLPPVPGAPIYLAAGFMLVAVGKSNGWTVVAGCLYTCAFSLVIKLVACTLQQKLIGERLAESLQAGIGDSLLLYSVAYSLEMAYELFTVVGTMKLPDPGMERALAVVHLLDAQDFFVYGDRVSEVAILASSADDTGPLVSAVSAGFPGDAVEVHGWTEIMPELVQLIFLDDAGMYIMLVILVVVVAFGILNTLLMSVLERRREFGVALALGLRPRAIFGLVYLESMALAAVGLGLGLALALPLVLYLVGHPIELTSEEMVGAMELWGFEPRISWKLLPTHPLWSAVTIFGVAALAALYPAIKASRARPVDALRSV